jgi:uncharacterized protein (TIGR02001 family)
MSRLTSLILGAALMGSAVTASAAEVAGNVTLATDYRFRGISQLNGELSPAIQGGFDFATEMGFYVGAWASNVNLGNAGQIETDYYGGFKGTFNEDVGYDIGLLYYGYPKDNVTGTDYDYTEVYGSVTFKGVKVGLNYSDDYFAESGEFFYTYVDYGFDPIENVTLSFHLAYNSFDEAQAGLDGDDNYTDWKIAASTKQLGVNWALAYVDTDLDDDASCFGNEDLCAATAVFSISKSL